MDETPTRSSSPIRAETNGHATSNTSAPRTRHLMAPVAFWLGCGCMLLATANAGLPLWARATTPAADMAMTAVAIGLAMLGVTFLPILAGSWRIALLNAFVAVIFVGLAGAIEGTTLTAVAATQLKLLVLVFAVSTIWIGSRQYRLLQQACWCLLLAWSIGLPTAAYLSADFGSQQGSASTLLHFSMGRLLQ